MNPSEIVNILSLSKKSFGTGFFVSQNGNILTCKHILEEAGYKERGQLIYYKYEDDATVHKARWVKSADEEDLVILETNAESNYIPIHEENTLDLVADSYGFPNGSKRKIKASVTIDRMFKNERYIQLGNANTVTFGFSGAPLLYNDVAIGIINTVGKTDTNGHFAEVAFAISAKRIIEVFSEDVSKRKVCRGYGNKEENCVNYAISESEDLCEECYTAQFFDIVKSVYEAQNYIIYQYDSYFVASLKYGISTYYDAIFIKVKFGDSICLEEVYSIKEQIEECCYNISQIIIVTNTTVDRNCLSFIEKNRIVIRTKKELFYSLFDFKPYKEDLRKHVESKQLSSHYIEIYGTSFLKPNKRREVNQYNLEEEEIEYCDEEKVNINKNTFGYKPKTITMKEYVDEFLESEHRALLILGDYGSGKTSFCYTYTNELLDKFIQGKSRFLPVLIKLRKYNKAVNVVQLLTDYFINDLGVNNFNILSLKLLLKNINVVLIFDGFDEIAKKVDFDIKYEAIKEICSLVENETKIIVTCRPNYFKNESEYKRIFQNSDFMYEPGEKQMPEFIENTIAELELPQIEKYIESFHKELDKINISVSEVLQTIANTHDLTDLAKRPFLLYMILNTLPKILKEEATEAKFKINAYRLYVVYTDNWIKREDSKNKTLIKKEDKELFCKELAFQLYISNAVSLSYKDFPKIIKNHFKDIERIEEIDYFTHDIQSCSFLTSDRSGEFKFVHDSFMEFFVADRIIAKLSDSLKKYKKDDKIIEQINSVLGKIYLSMEICLFIKDMVDYTHDNIIEKVMEYFNGFNNIAKTNFLSILAKTKINMAKILEDYKISGDMMHVDFSYTKFKEKVLRGISFKYVHFYSAEFEDVTFINCNFVGTIFEKALLSNVKFYNCKFCFSKWKETYLSNCTVNGKEKRDIYYLLSHFEEALDFIIEMDNKFCDFTGTVWEKSTIIDCEFNKCSFIENHMAATAILRSNYNEIDFSDTNISLDCRFENNRLSEVVGEPYEF